MANSPLGKYSRKLYKSRGKLPRRDIIGETKFEHPCVWCESMITRKVYKSGLETIAHMVNRKTCSRECYLNAFIRGKNNPHYKGYMPTCKDCGKRIYGYPMHSKGEKRTDTKFARCKECYLKWSKDSGFAANNPGLKRAIARAKRLGKEGVKHLEEYNFKKGHQLSRKHFHCQVEGCDNEHLAKGLCNKHYHRKSRRDKKLTSTV